MYSFLHGRCFQRSWGILIAALILDDLLQNGVFTSEFGTRNSYFGRSIWICCLQIYILWRLPYRIARRCRLRDHAYQPQKVLSREVTCIRSCMLFCVYIPISEDVWVGWRSFETILERLKLFRRVLNYSFCMWPFEVGMFISRSLTFGPGNFVGFLPSDVWKPSLDWKVHWDLCWDLGWRLMGGKPTFKWI